MERLNPNPNFWKNKKVFITGHTGFKGSWLCLLLNYLGADVYGYALKPNTKPSLFEQCEIDTFMHSIIGDIRDEQKLQNSIKKIQPSIVLHLAAQPIVRASYIDPKYTYETNVMGTLNLFEAVRKIDSVRALVNVTTDKCYDNKETLKSYNELDNLGGYDPYSSSKACSEILTASYRNSYFNSDNYDKHKLAIASARAGNVIGGGDWADDRLIPDFLRSILNNKQISIRNPLAIRPWQHVLEPLTGYLLLAEHLCNYGCDYAEAWNFGPNQDDVKEVKWIVEKLYEGLKMDPNYLIDNNSNPHEAHYLKLDSSKSNARLNWKPNWDINKALMSIIEFINCYKDNGDLKELCENQMKLYFK